MARSRKVPRKTLARLDGKDFFFDYFMAGAPLVVTDWAKGWPALKKWSTRYLKDTVGSKVIPVFQNEAGVSSFLDLTRTSIRFSKAADLIESGKSPIYVVQIPIPKEFPELMNDIGDPRHSPSIIPPSVKIQMPNLWFGCDGCKTGLHFDRPENLLVQIRGRKRITLFSPDQSQFLYPSFNKEAEYNRSKADFFAKDSKILKSPLRIEAKPFATLTLEPGQCVYIPSKWWHAVEAMDVSISVNFWW